MTAQRYPIPAAPPRYASIRGWGWVPEALKPYVLLLRLDRPTGYWLLFLPAAFALCPSALSPETGAWTLLSSSPYFHWLGRFCGALICDNRCRSGA